MDGAVAADTGQLADGVAQLLRDGGRPVVPAARAGFMRPRSIRLEPGDDPDAPWQRWYDDPGLRRELLDPLGPGGSLVAAGSLWDVRSDRATREPRRSVPAGTVAVVDGPFLLRPELAEGFDLVVHLQTSTAAMGRRGASALAPSWQRYLREVAPAAAAGFVVRYDDPRHPALVHAEP